MSTPEQRIADLTRERDHLLEQVSGIQSGTHRIVPVQLPASMIAEAQRSLRNGLSIGRVWSILLELSQRPAE